MDKELRHSKHSWYECPECARKWLQKFPQDTLLYMEYLEDEINTLIETIWKLKTDAKNNSR
jgi:hypothetical protein